jgi:hypothetical protein
VRHPIHERGADKRVCSCYRYHFIIIDDYSTSSYFNTFVSGDERVGLGNIRNVRGYVTAEGVKKKKSA